LEQAFIPYHDGAIRYFREIGVWTPAAEAKQQENIYRQEVLMQAWESFLPGAPQGYGEFEQAWLSYRTSALEAENLITLADTQ